MTVGEARLPAWKALSSASHPGTNSWAFTLDYETMQWMQLDQNGDANSWSLGEYEVRVMMLDPACTKSLTFREYVNGPIISPSRLRSRTPTTGPVKSEIGPRGERRPHRASADV